MSSLDAALFQATLACDVAYIIKLFQAECNCDMDPSRFVLSRGFYTTSVDMYRNILIIVNGLGIGAEILEMMPYIDDYLEYYFS
jgi:hypothetical protein